MAINEERSYTEYNVEVPTTDFPIGFDILDDGLDVVAVTLNDVDPTTLGYTVIQVNNTTYRFAPAVQSGVVRLTRITDIDQMAHVFTEGAIFISENMDGNFKQIRHAQQEVRDSFSKLATDTYAVIDGLDEALELAQDAAQDAQAAADTVNAFIVDGKIVTAKVLDASGKTQQEINNLYNRNGTPYFRTIFEFMPKSVVDDVFGAKVLDHAPYLQAALDAVGVGGRLWIPLTAAAYLNIGQTIQITSSHKSIHIIGSRGTASRGSSYTTFRHFGETEHDMFYQYRTWGVIFEDCSFDGLDKSDRLMTLIAEAGSDPAKVMHRFNFIRCGFDSAKDKLVQIGDGGNEDIAEVNFESCHFASISATEPLASAGIYIDAPQGYSINFNTCFFIRNVNMPRMFHIRSGNVTMSAVTFDGAAGSTDIYLDPYTGALMPQVTVTNGESQSGTFLDTVSGVGLFPDRNVVLINVRHRADNGQESPVSINWDLGHQSQLIHVGCNFHCINVGANAASVVELAPTWTRRGGSLYKITGYTGNTSVVTGLNGYNITEANRTIKGGMRVGDNFLSVCPSNANNDPSLFVGNKIDGDFWINNKGDLTKALPNIYRYQADGSKIAISDSAVYAKYTRTVVANASKYNYILDFPIVPQLGAIYEVRWNILADNANSIYESGVMNVAIVAKGSNTYVRKQDISLFQELTPILTTAAAMRLTSSGAESASASASQTALNLFTLRIKFLNAIDNVADGTSLRCSIKRVGF